MKTIPLSKGMVAFVDDEDFERVNQYKWTAFYSKVGGVAYAQRSVKVNGKWTHVSLHRFIMNAQKGSQIDHGDGIGLNCQKYNLRFCTGKQNQRNVKCHRDNKHGLKGVGFRGNGDNPWTATIFANGKRVYLGCHPNKIDAAIAYNLAALKHFGEFSRLNPVPFVGG